MNRKASANLANVINTNTPNKKEKSSNFDVVFSKNSDSIPKELEIVASTLKTIVMNRLEASSNGEAHFDFNKQLSKEEAEMVASMFEQLPKKTAQSIREISTVLLSKALEPEFGADEIKEALADGWLNILANHSVALIEVEKINQPSEEESSFETSTKPAKRGRKKSEDIDFSNVQDSPESKEVKPLRKSQKEKAPLKTRRTTSERRPMTESSERRGRPASSTPRNTRQSSYPTSKYSPSPSRGRSPAPTGRSMSEHRPRYSDQRPPQRSRYGNSDMQYQKPMGQRERVEYGRPGPQRERDGYTSSREREMGSSHNMNSRSPRKTYSSYPMNSQRPRRSDMQNNWTYESNSYGRTNTRTQHSGPRTPMSKNSFGSRPSRKGPPKRTGSNRTRSN